MNTNSFPDRRAIAAVILVAAAFATVAFVWSVYVSVRVAALNAYAQWFLSPDITLFQPANQGLGRFLFVYQLPLAGAALLTASAMRTSVRWKVPRTLMLILVAGLIFLATVGTVSAITEWTHDYVSRLFAMISAPLALAALVYVRGTSAEADAQNGDAARTANIAAALITLVGLGLAIYFVVVQYASIRPAIAVLLFGWYATLAVALAAEYARLAENEALQTQLAGAAVLVLALVIAGGFWAIRVTEDTQGVNYTASQTFWTLLKLVVLSTAILGGTIVAGLRGQMLTPVLTVLVVVLSLIMGYHVGTGHSASLSAAAGLLLVLLPIAGSIFFCGLPDGDYVGYEPASTEIEEAPADEASTEAPDPGDREEPSV